ncbi:hypothetical protein SMB34_02615 [Thalassospira permensis NBRC 106175]|uniref:Uncharacterized protein n=1 Tax=Thalassospira permensis NBRC 106175 TaxID=1353532 RepID=A0ABR4TR41_9PROT|nr:hypothetical protein SMB34_02615 [Thalassospira permensis NBRC 106175]
MAAMLANMFVLCQVTVEDHLFARRALMPEIFGHFGAANKFLNLGTDEFCQPRHIGY